MTVSGVINIVNTVANAYDLDLFISIYNYLISAQAVAKGVSLIASCKGAGSSGTGFDYYGTANAVGNNTWAVFLFGNATIPFYVLLQTANYNVAIGVSPGAPGAAYVAGLCIQVALRPDGSSPWAGSTNANGTDTKGTPVWTENSSGLCVFPRQNSYGGSYSTSKQYLQSLTTSTSTSGYRSHFVIDENTIWFSSDSFVFSVGAFQSNFYFGKYTPFTLGFDTQHSLTTATVPYVMLGDALNTSAVFTLGGSPLYGPIVTPTVSYNGGVVNPVSPLSGTIGFYGDILYGAWVQQALNPNTGYAGGTQYDPWPIALWAAESENVLDFDKPAPCGFIGEITNYNYVPNVACGDTSPDLKYVFLGPTTLATSKMMFPWDGATTPAFGVTTGVKTGVIF
jgi:hypothetical protein